MAGKPLIEVKGARRLRSTMRQAGIDMAQMKGAHAAAARIAAAGAKSRAPYETGKLASTVRSSGTTTSGVVRAGFKRTPYAGPIEWGWPAGSGPKGTFGGESFISAGARETESAWVQVYQNEVTKILGTIKGL